MPSHAAGQNFSISPIMSWLRGSCKLVCPVDAITEKPNPIGLISQEK